MGVDVPRDLSIVAWDGSVLCEIIHPPLTVLSRDIMAYAWAAERLALLDGDSVGDFEDAMPRLIAPRQHCPPTRPSGGRLAGMRLGQAAALAAALLCLALPASAQEVAGAEVALRLQDPRIQESSGMTPAAATPRCLTRQRQRHCAELYAVGPDGRTLAT